MTTNFYMSPSHMTGGYTVYGGYRRQRGGKLFGSFRKIMAPIGKQLARGAKQVARGVKHIAKNKTVQKLAKKAAEKGAEVAAGVAIDALHGRDLGQSIKERSREAALEVLTPSERSAPRRVTNRKLKQSSRKPSASIITRAPARKRSTSTKLQGPKSKRRRYRRRLSRAALNRKDLF